MTEYEAIEATSPKELAARVNARLHDGWTLVGGVSVTVYRWENRDDCWETEFTYVQAMAK